MNEMVIADIGGTHVRFSTANISDARNIAIECEVTLECSAHASLQIAWHAFGAWK